VDTELLETQNEIDKEFLSFDSAQDDNSKSSSNEVKDINSISPEQCLNTSFTEEELEE
jgi:hypothetical protein